MELEGIMLSEISQEEKDKYQMVSLKNGLTVTKGKGTEEDVWEGTSFGG